MTTASAIVAVAPLAVGHGGFAALLREVVTFLRLESVTSNTQRHVLASVTSWMVMLEGLAVFWLARRVVAVTGRAPVLAAMAVSAVIVAGLGIWQWWTGAYLLPFWLQVDPFLRRINATFTDVNALGAFLGMLLPAAVWLALTTSTRGRRAFWWLGVCAIVTANVFTASRVAWVGMAVGGLVMAGLVWHHGVVPLPEQTRRRLRHATFAAGAGCAVLLIGLATWGTVRDVRVVEQRSYLDPVVATLNFRAPLAERLKGRLAFWEAAGHMVAERPLAGIGIGRFFKDVSRYASNPALLPRQQENAHNYFLQLAAEQGLPALAVLLAIWTAALRRASRDLSDSRCRAGERWAAAAACAGVVAFAVTCLTGHSLLLREGQFTTWTLVAVALGAPAPGGSAAPARRRWLPWLVLLVVVLSVVPRALAAIDAVDRTRVFEGFYDEEVGADGRAYRWTEHEALFHVPAEAVRLSFTVRSLSPTPQGVDVAVDGRAVDRLTLDDHNWRVVRYVLPAKRSGAYRSIRLRVSPTWRAPGDGRDLGVMLAAIEWMLPTGR